MSVCSSLGRSVVRYVIIRIIQREGKLHFHAPIGALVKMGIIFASFTLEKIEMGLQA